MASRIFERAGRAALPLMLAFLAVFILIAAFQKQQWDSDIFWALKSGEWIVANFSVPHTDPFSYTFGGKPWVDFTWGFQVLAWLAYTFLGGWAGLSALQVVLVSLTFVFLYMTLGALLPGRQWLRVSLLLVVYAAAHGRLFIRPHLFEFFFVSLFIMLLTLHEKHGKPVYLFLILPFEALWVNIHSSAILGLFITGSYAAGKLIDEVRLRGAKNFDLDRKVLIPGLVALLSPVAALLNPYGPKLVIFPFIHHGVDNKDAIRHIAEWMRPEFKDLFFFFYPWPIEHFGFVVLFLAAMAAIALNAKKTPAWAYMLFAGGLYMAVSHVRWTSLFAAFAAPVLAMGLRGSIERLDGLIYPRRAALALAVFLTAILAVKHFSANGEYVANMGLGLRDGKFPEGTVAYMKKEGLRGNVYNDYVFGGYLIYELPGVKVFIDGRTPTVYSSYFFWTSRLAEDHGRWKRLEEEHDIDMVLVKLESDLCERLREDNRWAAASFDDVSILYLRKDRFPSQASRSFSSFSPCSSGAKLELPDDRGELARSVEELERVVSSGSDSARARRLLGLAYTKLGKEGQPGENGAYARAAVEFRKALAEAEDAHIWYDLGVALGKDKKRIEAIAAFKKAVDLDKSFKQAYLALGAALHDNGDDKEAIEVLTRYIDLADDKSDVLSYASLGKSYFRTGQFDKAAVYLKRAAFLTDDKKELADLSYSIGNSFVELAEYDEALLWYAKALSLKPDYAGVLRELSTTLRRDGKGEAADRISGLLAPEARKTAAN